MEEKKRLRTKSKILKVTFPDGKVICFRSATETFIETLRNIGSERFDEITLELNHLPLVSSFVPPRLSKWMKPICDGWFLNIQSNTDMKFIQLKSISDSLQLGLRVEIGEDFETEESAEPVAKRKVKEKLRVTLPDGEVVACSNGADTFVEVVKKLGTAEVERRHILYANRPLFSVNQATRYSVEIDRHKWITVPTTTKERAKLLRIIASLLRVNLTIEMW